VTIMVRLIGAMILLFIVEASAQTFYVDGARGNYANDCIWHRPVEQAHSSRPVAHRGKHRAGSEIRRGPCATIQAAVNKTNATGDTIYVADWDQTYPSVSVTY